MTLISASLYTLCLCIKMFIWSFSSHLHTWGWGTCWLCLGSWLDGSGGLYVSMGGFCFWRFGQPAPAAMGGRRSCPWWSVRPKDCLWDWALEGAPGSGSLSEDTSAGYYADWESAGNGAWEDGKNSRTGQNICNIYFIINTTTTINTSKYWNISQHIYIYIYIYIYKIWCIKYIIYM